MPKTLEDEGGRLVLRSGDALDVLRALVRDTGATKVVWNRLYDPSAQARDSRIKAALKDDGIAAESFNAHLLFEPWTVETGTGGPYRVYTPFWKAVRGRDVPAPLAVPNLRFPRRVAMQRAAGRLGAGQADAARGGGGRTPPAAGGAGGA